MATWPVSVPYASLVSGFSIVQPFKEPRRTEFDEGPDLARPASTLRIATIQERIHMTEAQWSTLDNWVSITIDQGTAPFTKQVYKPGTGHVSKTCRLREAPTASKVSPDTIAVSLVLDVENY